MNKTVIAHARWTEPGASSSQPTNNCFNIGMLLLLLLFILLLAPRRLLELLSYPESSRVYVPSSGSDLAMVGILLLLSLLSHERSFEATTILSAVFQFIYWFDNPPKPKPKAFNSLELKMVDGCCIAVRVVLLRRVKVGTSEQLLWQTGKQC